MAKKKSWHGPGRIAKALQRIRDDGDHRLRTLESRINKSVKEQVPMRRIQSGKPGRR